MPHVGGEGRHKAYGMHIDGGGVRVWGSAMAESENMRIRIGFKLSGAPLLICAAVSVFVGVIAASRLPYAADMSPVLDFMSSFGLVLLASGVLVATIAASERLTTRIIGAKIAVGASRARMFWEVSLGGLMLPIVSTMLGAIACCVVPAVRGHAPSEAGDAVRSLCDFGLCIAPLVALASMGVASTLAVQDTSKASLLVVAEQLSLVAIMMAMVHDGASGPLPKVHPMVFVRMLAKGTLPPVDVVVGECISMCWVVLLLGLGWMFFRRCELR